MKKDPIGVIVVDDSAHQRRELGELLRGEPAIELLATAADGEEAYKKIAAHRPEVITLDLEMPKLGGFALLRLLMTTSPVKVIVISSYSHRSDVFRALELGAFDFIAKPKRRSAAEVDAFRAELLEKIHAARLARSPPRRQERGQARGPLVIALAASTGGPQAVQRILEGLAAEPTASLLVAQHMPPMFTRAFADRLDKLGPYRVREAHDGDSVMPGHAYIAPGGRQLFVHRRRGGRLEVKVRPPASGEAHAPSADVLFESLAQAVGPGALGVVLTGMGSDGAAGARALKAAGAQVWAESEKTAVIYGMPKQAIATGAVARVLPLNEIGRALVMESRRRSMPVAK